MHPCTLCRAPSSRMERQMKGRNSYCGGEYFTQSWMSLLLQVDVDISFCIPVLRSHILINFAAAIAIPNYPPLPFGPCASLVVRSPAYVVYSNRYIQSCCNRTAFDHCHAEIVGRLSFDRLAGW